MKKQAIVMYTKNRFGVSHKITIDYEVGVYAETTEVNMQIEIARRIGSQAEKIKITKVYPLN